MRTTRATAVAVTVVAAFALAGCVGGTAKGSGPATFDPNHLVATTPAGTKVVDHVTWGMHTGEPDTIDPVRVGADSGYYVIANLCDTLLLTTTHIATFAGSRILTSASGFFFRRGDRLFLVSNRHVFVDAANSHFPDRIEIGLHTDERDLTRHTVVTLPLYHDGVGLWREATDTAGKVDVAAMEIPAPQLPPDAVLHAFDESPLTIAGFPLGFHDMVHHLAVARSASIASAYGVRFQCQGYFLTDARTHRGSSGSPVVRRRMREDLATSQVCWQLLGVHSTRMDMRNRDQAEDESLGLNCAWYADVLLTLTADG